MQRFLAVYHGVSHLLKASAYTEKIQVTRGIFLGIPLESVAQIVRTRQLKCVMNIKYDVD